MLEISLCVLNVENAHGQGTPNHHYERETKAKNIEGETDRSVSRLWIAAIATHWQGGIVCLKQHTMSTAETRWYPWRRQKVTERRRRQMAVPKLPV